MKTLWNNTTFLEKLWIVASFLYSLEIGSVIWKFCDSLTLSFFMCILPGVGLFTAGYIIGKNFKK